MAFNAILLVGILAIISTSPSVTFAKETPVAPILDVSSLNRSSFPAGFIFGTASAAYQVYHISSLLFLHSTIAFMGGKYVNAVLGEH